MVRGRGFSSRSSYRGSSRGNSWNGGSPRGGYMDSRSKYDRFSNSRDDYHKSYKSVSVT